MLVNNIKLAIRVLNAGIKRTEWNNTFQLAGAYAARTKSAQDCVALADQIRAAADTEWTDLFLVGMVEAFSVGKKEYKTAELLITKMTNAAEKVTGYIAIKKLKSAYLVAVKATSKDLVKKILVEAEKDQDTATAKLCTKYLDQAT